MGKIYFSRIGGYSNLKFKWCLKIHERGKHDASGVQKLNTSPGAYATHLAKVHLGGEPQELW